MLRWMLYAVACCGVLAQFWPTVACAQRSGWATGSAQIIVPYGAGGPTDTTSRLVASNVAGQHVVVDNLPASDILPAIEYVKRASPDGGVLLMLSYPDLIMRQRSARSELVAVAMLAEIPFALAAKPSGGVSTLPDLLALVRQSPKSLRIVSAGVNSPSDIAASMFMRLAQVRLSLVPVTNTTEINQRLLGGDADLAFTPLAVARRSPVPLHIIGIATEKRLGSDPSLPTLNEQGLPGFEMRSWIGLFASSGTPPTLVRRISNDILASASLPKVADGLRKIGAQPLTMTPDEMEKFIQQQANQWKEVVRKNRTMR